jgi:SNF2 family DNA or RNA helicase
LETADGWIDLSASAFSYLDRFLQTEDILSGSGERTRIRLSPMEFLRFASSVESDVRINASDQKASLVERFLALRPAVPFADQKESMTPLRPYQRIGVDWLCFLYENKLGGLLCDDMGLGKTHQAMALMIWLRKRKRMRKPIVVVVPTSVISHWRDKIREHAPDLKAVVYHGPQRDLRDAIRVGDVLITSYGLLRNDLPRLREVPFALAVFDEVQSLKNRETRSYQAARLLNASVKLGLTGTPIENSLDDLKSLFDLILPGYLGSDEDFAHKYADSHGDLDGDGRMAKLRRIVAPFMLRRVKQAVLDELPEKIEDVRSCRLSELQVKLYRDILESKGNALVELIRAKEQRLPYIHIFAVLNHLKRICDHPALALNRVDQFEKYSSGKWELLQELLFESLDSRQKVVVFSQYLGMIRMMERLLETLEIGFVSLTGASVNRGEIVRRFNEDEECRVFLGSLKAGGIGIDLIAGTVVIHYDRWWNAAREDQATDRCHRIGQKKAVQVFKLIAEGTLEEKISAIIERKRRLMETVIQPDNPRLQKTFTRDELIDLLSPV